MRAKAILSASVVAAVLGACEPSVPETRVTDPAGDQDPNDRGPDISAAGARVDGNEMTLFIEYHLEGGSGNILVWGVSTDGDTTAELVVEQGGHYYESTSPDRYRVTWVAPDTGEYEFAGNPRCTGFSDRDGPAGRDELVVDARCLAPSDGSTPESVRVRAQLAERFGASDSTGWSPELQL